jgi:hypothetical protein
MWCATLLEDDERLLLVVTLAVRNGQFGLGAATEYAPSQYGSLSTGS